MGDLKHRIVVKSDGRITIPETTRKQLGIRENSVLELEVYAGDKILLTVLVK